jgi:hypothetical protein
LPGRIAHRHDANLVAVLFAEQRTRTRLLGVLDAHQAGFDRRILQHDVVGDVLDLRHFLRRDRLGVRRSRSAAGRRDQRALLRDVIAEHQAQRLVQQMRRRMVRADRRAARVIDLQLQRRAEPSACLPSTFTLWPKDAVVLLRIGDAELRRFSPLSSAGIADLPAALAVERRLVEDDIALLARFERFDIWPPLTSAVTTPSAASVS